MKYTYFIQNMGDRTIKIGSAGNPLARLAQLQIACSSELALLAATTLVEERAMHAEFAQYRIRGEWFVGSDALLDRIAQIQEDMRKYPVHCYTGDEDVQSNPSDKAPANVAQECETKSRTRFLFDLRDELTPEEIAQFEENAAKAGASNLTEHFLSLTLRLQKAATEGGAQ